MSPHLCKERKGGPATPCKSGKERGTRALAPLQAGEVAAKGAGHAEVTGVNAAKQVGLTPTGVAASRPICADCAGFLKSLGLDALSPLK